MSLDGFAMDDHCTSFFGNKIEGKFMYELSDISLSHWKDRKEDGISPLGVKE